MFTSAKKVTFHFVCLFFLLAQLLKNYSTDFHKIRYISVLMRITFCCGYGRVSLSKIIKISPRLSKLQLVKAVFIETQCSVKVK